MRTAPPLQRFVSRQELLRLLGISASTLWRMQRDGVISAPVRVSPGRVAWPLEVIERWMADRRAA